MPNWSKIDGKRVPVASWVLLAALGRVLGLSWRLLDALGRLLERSWSDPSDFEASLRPREEPAATVGVRPREGI